MCGSAHGPWVDALRIGMVRRPQALVSSSPRDCMNHPAEKSLISRPFAGCSDASEALSTHAIVLFGALRLLPFSRSVVQKALKVPQPLD
jgi:hypothetical protein